VPEVADTARKYIHTCIRECIEPLSDEMPHGPQAIPLIQTLMSLIGVDIDKEQLDPIHNANGYAVPSTSGYTTNVNTATSINPSPMSVQTIVSDWNNEPPKADAASAAAWQCLFSSAATPFFENEADWQGKVMNSWH
jgi:hypothetical protein